MIRFEFSKGLSSYNMTINCRSTGKMQELSQEFIVVAQEEMMVANSQLRVCVRTEMEKMCHDTTGVWKVESQNLLFGCRLFGSDGDVSRIIWDTGLKSVGYDATYQDQEHRSNMGQFQNNSIVTINNNDDDNSQFLNSVAETVLSTLYVLFNFLTTPPLKLLPQFYKWKN